MLKKIWEQSELGFQVNCGCMEQPWEYPGITCGSYCTAGGRAWPAGWEAELQANVCRKITLPLLFQLAKRKMGERHWAKAAQVTWAFRGLRTQLQVTKSQGCPVPPSKPGKRPSSFLRYLNELCNSNLTYSLASSPFSCLSGHLLTAT